MKKRPRDLSQLAASIVADATGKEPGEADSAGSDGEKNPAAVAVGRLGGLKGGKARAAKLSPERRREIAIAAAKARWKKAHED